MTSRYEVLATLVESAANSHGADDLGYHHVLVGILRELHAAENDETTKAEMANAIYDRIADSELGQRWDANGANAQAD
ncbi:MAG: hypothetical protein JWQ12_658 [Glaciihabitans sp.]|nr:hypothetical protein [Glaciihabitans sp.]